MKTLLAQHHELSDTGRQMQLLEEVVEEASLLSFKNKLQALGFYPLTSFRHRNFPGECWEGL
jgi:hypothetical protein